MVEIYKIYNPPPPLPGSFLLEFELRNRESIFMGKNYNSYLYRND